MFRHVRRPLPWGIPLKPLIYVVAYVVALLLWNAVPAEAQTGLVCCEYTARSVQAGRPIKTRECEMLPRGECGALAGRLFPGLRCDPHIVACTRGYVSLPATVTPTATPSPTPQTQPVATATPGSPRDMGCCQLNTSTGPVCEDSITRAHCLGLFDGQATFCAGCVCSGRPGPRLDFNPGTCVESSTPTTRGRPPRPLKPRRPVRPARPR